MSGSNLIKSAGLASVAQVNVILSTFPIDEEQAAIDISYVNNSIHWLEAIPPYDNTMPIPKR